MNNNGFQPSLLSRLEQLKPHQIIFSLSFTVVGTYVVTLIHFAILVFLFTNLGFWYSVAFLTVYRLIIALVQDHTKYRMEQEIMKGGK